MRSRVEKSWRRLLKQRGNRHCYLLPFMLCSPQLLVIYNCGPWGTFELMRAPPDAQYWKESEAKICLLSWCCHDRLHWCFQWGQEVDVVFYYWFTSLKPDDIYQTTNGIRFKCLTFVCELLHAFDVLSRTVYPISWMCLAKIHVLTPTSITYL